MEGSIDQTDPEASSPDFVKHETAKENRQVNKKHEI